MLAHRVVLQRGLDLEPLEWLASIDEDTYRGWEAYYRLEPWGNEQTLLARLICEVNRLVVMKAGKDVLVEVQNLMPGDWAWRKDDTQTPEEFEKVARQSGNNK